MYYFFSNKVKNIFNTLGLGDTFLLIFLLRIKNFFKKRIKSISFDQISINLAEHCNFSCFSCNHFAPLAEEKFPVLNTVINDLKHLSKLSSGNIQNIHLSGGEPLLNPEIIEFMRISRECFINSNIKIITNGLLLLSQKDIFWESIKNYKITLVLTKYPGIDWDRIEDKANKFGCKFDYIDSTRKGKKMSRRFSLDLSGKQNARKSFFNCTISHCAILENGRIAMCPIVFSVRHFNKYFNQQIPVTDMDSIDIYNVESMKEITDFIQKPIPLCSYCKSMGKNIVGDWRNSERKIEEWT